MTTICAGLLFALAFVAVRGCNSAHYFLAKRELPDMALVAVTSLISAIVALALCVAFERPDWGKLLAPSSLKWTLAAGTLSVVSVYAALRSYEYIPQWLTQSFIGFEPFFGLIGIILVSRVVLDNEIRQSLMARLPSNWWLFLGGLFLVVMGVILLALATRRSTAEPSAATDRGGM